ncbi:pyridine nucleotide-disulfide oxidoreductase family protein [Synechococcus sp. PCC 7502]|uniref:FAD-dependent oxidoreductase n=1 Tax=Synechococcus sp. PCC 7502 TaxID=1173263 RepID=UPI00029FA46C|nr:FAD-dependent oxidoreductase [Synechococcus sp. PCC 7502]AFY74710.1 pyridine nucleotide-disulfide oxidoreductase family protein [Synechococcus sp. PCC 7502]
MQNLVLLGGGHSHAIALRLLGLNPLPQVRLILISDVMEAPYSGMLPGHIAGLYSHQECHINLLKLANFAQADLILDRAVSLDLEHQLVICQNHVPVPFDYLSIDIGSTPATNLISGAEYAIPVKPVPQFLEDWENFLEEIKVIKQSDRLSLPKIGIVGGGAGGVELALTMQARTDCKIHLCHRSSTLMSGYVPDIGHKFAQLLQQRGIKLHLNQTVNAITEDISNKALHCNSGLTINCDRIFWVTNATAPDWIKNSGIATDIQGFIAIDHSLRSLSHPNIFATGDIATIKDDPRPKAGVFAVRQGKPLYQNLRRVTLGKTPIPFYPQKQHLALIGTGDGRAIAVRGRIMIGASKLLWIWKDRIDRKFMAQFVRL